MLNPYTGTYMAQAYDEGFNAALLLDSKDTIWHLKYIASSPLPENNGFPSEITQKAKDKLLTLGITDYDWKIEEV